MKLVRIVMLFISVYAVSGCGNGVATLDPVTGNKAPAVTVSDGNSKAVTPGTDTNGSGTNPAHGKPGHRCDLAVGAPLSSNVPAQPSIILNPATATTPASGNPISNLQVPLIMPGLKAVSNPATNITPNMQSIAGLNPPHGQPGHRCDIPAGKPLNSTASTANMPTLPSALPTLTSPVITPPATSTAAPGMNPAHGQPGHRCDIPVGKPLNSKPAQ